MIEPLSDCRKKLRQTEIELQLEKDHIKQLENLLNHNPDTGLLQRHILTRRLNKMINEIKEPFAFGILRLDKNYQRIRHTRDRMKVLLYVSSERLKSLVGEANLYQSDRSDEFLFVIPNISEEKDVEERIEQMIMKISESHQHPATDVNFGCNVGVALYPKHAHSVDELEVNAEIALGIYEAKSWNGFLYNPEIGEDFHESQSLEYSLRMSVLNSFEGFHVAYQPIVDGDRKLIACEALLRWDSPDRGSVSPVRFIPLAEESNLICHLGKWVLYNALRQVKIWRNEKQKDLQVSVNISSVQLEQDDFYETIATALDVLQLPGNALHIEITESAVMSNPEVARLKLMALQEIGIEIMMDDFGTGYSSLSALNSFPVNTLKIAKEFVDDLPESPHSLEMVRAILGIARTFGFTTLAEGIEQEDQFECLIDEGCRYIQGYISSPPVGATEFEEKFLSP